jgi:hypothetical protein
LLHEERQADLNISRGLVEKEEVNEKARNKINYLRYLKS